MPIVGAVVFHPDHGWSLDTPWGRLEVPPDAPAPAGRNGKTRGRKRIVRPKFIPRETTTEDLRFRALKAA